MKKMKKIFAALLAIAMMAPMALAAETSETSVLVGQGTYASPANAAVWSIQFPTADRVAFTVDPTGLVKSSGRYGEEVTAAIDATDTVLFPNYDNEGNLNKYSKISAPLEVVNKSTSDITVELNARLTDTKMTIKSAALTSSETDTAIVFKMAAGSSDSIDPATSSEFIPTVGLTKSVDVAAKTNAFSTVYTNGVYTKQINGEVVDENFQWNKAVFKVMGEASNTDAAKLNWEKELDMNAPSLKLTWHVRNKAADAIKIEFDSTALTGMGTNYFMAADCLYALPGQAVNVYVQPKPVARDATVKNVVISGPSKINTATKNYDDGSVTIVEEDKAVFFSNGTASDNDMMMYTFLVPGEKGSAGFTTKYKAAAGDTTLTDGNKIVIKGAPTIGKREVSVTYNSSSVA